MFKNEEEATIDIELSLEASSQNMIEEFEIVFTNKLLNVRGKLDPQ